MVGNEAIGVLLFPTLGAPWKGDIVSEFDSRSSCIPARIRGEAKRKDRNTGNELFSSCPVTLGPFSARSTRGSVVSSPPKAMC